MPMGDPDPTDPMTLHGVVVGTDNDGAMREMAECFIEEFARLGYDARRILELFRTRAYAGPFLACQELGEAVIRALVSEHMELRGASQHPVDLDRRKRGDIGLPVLD